MKMLDSARGWFWNEFLIISAIFSAQLFFGFQNVALIWILNLGFKPLFLVASWCLSISIILLPFTIIFERKAWPAKWSLSLVAQFVLLAFVGVGMFQAFLTFGTRKTSPAIAGAMMNITPGLIFAIAAFLRFERFEIRCKYTKVKIVGTLVCLSGAVAISFLQNSSSSPSSNAKDASLDDHKNQAIHNDWMLGCFYIFASVVCLSCYTILQAVTLRCFPAPMFLCSMINMIGSIFIVILQIMIEGKINMGTHKIHIITIIAVMLEGGLAAGIAQSLQAWGVRKKGPVMAAIFIPAQTVCSTVFSAIVLGQLISWGSVAGIILMFAGLYLFLWAKKNEDSSSANDAEADSTQPIKDIERPLLS